MAKQLESGSWEPDPVELLILRNQRAIMKHMVLVSKSPASELIDQAQETYAFLKRLDALKPGPAPDSKAGQ